MTMWTRRSWLAGIPGALATPLAAPFSSAGTPGSPAAPATGRQSLDLRDFQPRSMLRVPETRVERARFPVIDWHTHLSWRRESSGGVPLGEDMTYLATPEELLGVMDRKNVRTMVNFTGGVGEGLLESIRRFQQPFPDRFIVLTEPHFDRVATPGYAAFQADEIERAHRAGARGLKILKTLGLFLREQVTSGPLIRVDDPRFDPMWEACGALGMPVAIHVADPEAFFLPTDRFNERFEELSNHPDWSFHGKDFPSFRALIKARDRLMARHPRTVFVALHIGHHAEDLAAVSEALDRFKNMHVETGARIGELGRQPRAARRFFDKYQDRILFGTDAVPGGEETPQQIFGDRLYEIYYRFLETDDEYFDYAPAPVPPQGRWRIYGLALPEDILRKVYYENAARLLSLRP